MTAAELANELSAMYRNAPNGEMSVMVHLFGIRFPEAIRASGVTPAELARRAGIPESYGTEITKAVNLAKYVQVKPNAPLGPGATSG